VRYGIQKADVGRGYWVVARLKRSGLVTTRRVIYCRSRVGAVCERDRRNRLEKQQHREFVRGIRKKT
jgi:hypothetical protein